MGASAEKPADSRERARGWEGLEGGDIEEGDAGDAAGGYEGGGYAESLEDGDRRRHVLALLMVSAEILRHRD